MDFEGFSFFLWHNPADTEGNCDNKNRMEFVETMALTDLCLTDSFAYSLAQAFLN